MAGRVRTFSRSLNQAFCTRIAWERIVCATSVYGIEAITNSKGWIKGMELEEGMMCRYITGGSLSCNKAGLVGEIGWLPVRAKICFFYEI